MGYPHPSHPKETVVLSKYFGDAAARTREQAGLVREYVDRFANPYVAAERGFVDEVVDPAATRAALVGALHRLQTKREPAVGRSHSNSPL
jgi:propionyl-CoA carboxylase beta chain